MVAKALQLTVASHARLPAGLDELLHEAGVILERINYPGLTTVYPPVAQAAFALAYWLKPWSLDAWRLVGRIGVVTADDGGSATLRWHQMPQRYEIDVLGPFGKGLVRLYGNDKAAVLGAAQ